MPNNFRILLEIKIPKTREEKLFLHVDDSYLICKDNTGAFINKVNYANHCTDISVGLTAIGKRSPYETVDECVLRETWRQSLVHVEARDYEENTQSRMRKKYNITLPYQTVHYGYIAVKFLILEKLPFDSSMIKLKTTALSVFSNIFGGN